MNIAGFLESGALNTGAALLVSLIIAIGNSLEAWLGRKLLSRMIGRDQVTKFHRKVTGVLAFVCTAMLVCVVASVTGTTALYLAGVFDDVHYLQVAITWWTGDASGIFLFTPLLIVWLPENASRFPKRDTNYILEGFLLFFTIIFVSGLVFQLWFSTSFFFTRAFLITPFLIWAGMRFSLRIVLIAVLASAFFAIYGTLAEQGPFITGSLNTSLLTVEAYIGINAAMVLLLNAAIREQRSAHFKLREARDDLEKLVEHRTLQLAGINQQLEEAQRLAHIGSWEWNIPSNRISWSEELYRIYGVTESSFEPEFEKFLNLVHEDDRRLLENHVKATFDSGATFDFHHRIMKNGEIRILHARGELVRDEKGAPLILRGTSQDVTDEKRAEETIVRASQQLAEKNRELESSNRELAAFSYIASHDLQEPLRKIQLFADSILRNESETLSEKGQQGLERIRLAASHMKQLIIDLLAYSQVTNVKPAFEKTDLNSILEDVKDELKEFIEAKEATLQAGPLPVIEAIRFQMVQLFTNLLSNSLKFTRNGVKPVIMIKAEKAGKEDIPSALPSLAHGYWKISVRDNGTGFDAEYSQKIFEIFQRLHSTKNLEGKGIGLAICKKIVENHNGFIEAVGTVNEGAEFVMYFPATESSKAPE